MQQTYRPLIIPIETQVRELDAKLLLACVAAEEGFTSYFGSQTQIHKKAAALPRGIYLSKDVRSSKVRIFEILKLLGHDIMAWDEEGLVRYPSNHYFKTRVAPKALHQVSMMFAWGADDAEMLRNYHDYNGIPIHETGNPRIDMLRRELRTFYREDADELVKRFGRFALINTNFGHANHFLPKKTQTSPDNQMNGQDGSGNWDDDLPPYRNKLFNLFQEMTAHLGNAFPDKTIIVRPHPSESPEVWRRAAEGCDNVHVVYEGNVLPWLLACDVLVHNGCTTAVEAFLLDRPSVAYKPIVSDRFDRHLPDSLSFPAYNLEELVDQVKPFVESRRSCGQTADQKKSLDHHIAPQGQELAADRMVKIIKGSAIASLPAMRPGMTSQTIGWCRSHWRAVEKSVNSFIPGSKNWAEYERHRFPGISAGEVNAKIALFASRLARFENVSARQYSEGIFSVTDTSKQAVSD